MKPRDHFGESRPSPRGGLIALGIATGSTLLALAITSLVIPADSSPLFIFFLVAVLLSTFLAGWRSGLPAILFSSAMGMWYYFRPLHSLAVSDAGDLLRLLTFDVVAVGGVILIDQMQRLQRRERLLKALVDTSPSLTVVTDAAGRILLFNRKCEELSGYSAGEAVGKNLNELCVPQEWHGALHREAQRIGSVKVAEPYENPWKTRDGRLRLIEWRSVPIPSRLGEKPYVLALGIDISETQAARERVLNAERMAAQAEVINQLAHELNNPLQALTNVVELLRVSNGGTSSSLEYLMQAEEALTRMNSVSHTLLTVTAPPKAGAQSAGLEEDSETKHLTAD